MHELFTKVSNALTATRLRRLRMVVVFIAAGYGLRLFLREVHGHYPIQQWLFWSYAQIWGWCLLFTAACFSSGTLVMSRLVSKTFPLRERLVLTMPIGCLVFFYGLFLGGIARLFRPGFAVALPLILCGIGAWPSYRLLRRAWPHVRAARRRNVRAPAWWHYPAGLFGLTCLGAIYYAILSPKNIAFDSEFYHLGIAQQYVADGAILRSPESWWPLAVPHLSSVLYTWSMLLPGFNSFEHLVCSAHVEITIFIWTLLSIPTLVRWLAPKSDGRFTWVAMFLFPGIMLYDSLPSTAADHIAAFWCVPIFLAFRRAYVAVSPRHAALLALMLGGALLTKYQGSYLLFPALALAVRALWLFGARLVRRSKTEGVSATAPLVGLATAAAVGLAITSAHWLKNWVFYGDPLFPYLASVLKPEGHVPDVARLHADWVEWQSGPWVFHGSKTDKLIEAVKVLFTFSIEPHNFTHLHGKVPVFGSLFTLSSVLVLPFVKRSGRVWALVIATYIGLFLWYWTLPQDRYLQIILPWMAAATAATFALAWQLGHLARAGVMALIVAQVIWGGDVYFIPTHSMTGQSPVVTTSKLLAAGHSGEYQKRYTMGRLFKIGKVLPKDATVLMHEYNLRLGIQRRVVSDGAGWQFGIRYELLNGPRGVHEHLQRLGVTHIATKKRTSRDWDGMGADLQFFEYVRRYAQHRHEIAGFHIYELAAEPPPETGPRYVAYLGCRRFYQPGLYEVKDLHVRERGQRDVKRIAAPKTVPRNPEDLPALLAEATFVVTGNKCRYNAPQRALQPFELLAKRKNETLYMRKP